MSKRGFSTAAGVVAGVVLASLGVSAFSGSPGSQGAFDVASVLSRQANDTTGAALYTPESLTDALPNVTYQYNETEITESSAVVRGRFTSWSKGLATKFGPARTASESGVSTGWDDRDAVVQLFEFKVVPSEVLALADKAPALTAGNAIDVELRIDGPVDAGRFADQLMNHGPVVVFLKYDDTATGATPWSVAENGALIGTVASDGQIDMLGATETSAGSSVGQIDNDLTTVQALKAAAEEDRTVTVDDPLR